MNIALQHRCSIGGECMQLANARAIVPQRSRALQRLLTTLPRSAAVTVAALVGLLHAPTMLAQCTWTPGTGIITYTCGTSVGIGTTSPVTTLDIVRTSADGQTI